MVLWGTLNWAGYEGVVLGMPQWVSRSLGNTKQAPPIDEFG